MHQDGDIDFSRYTLEQLDDAVARIDRERYPINSRNLMAEHERRRAAEMKAAALAAKSGSPVIPDVMLNFPKVFRVSFAPAARWGQWLGASQNDFHLVGTGRVQVAGTVLRLSGRRFSLLLGFPVVQAEELGGVRHKRASL
jgi:hypothetical protein